MHSQTLFLIFIAIGVVTHSQLASAEAQDKDATCKILWTESTKKCEINEIFKFSATCRDIFGIDDQMDFTECRSECDFEHPDFILGDCPHPLVCCFKAARKTV